MDSSSLGTETKRFIDAVFEAAGEWLEPEYWVSPGFDGVYSHHVIFVSKAPYAYHSEAVYKRINGLGWQAPIAFEIWSQGVAKPDGKERLIASLQRYRFQSLSTHQTNHERIISEWLNLAGEREKLTVHLTGTKIVVHCGDCLQAGRLVDRLDWLVKTGLESVEIYIGKEVFTKIALERLAKDDRHRFIYALLRTHQEILEAGSIAIDDDKVRLYCASEEEAIALNHGEWDLTSAATRLGLPERIEIYYHTEGQGFQMYSSFTVQEAKLAEKLHRRELRATIENLDIAENP